MYFCLENMFENIQIGHITVSYYASLFLFHFEDFGGWREWCGANSVGCAGPAGVRVFGQSSDRQGCAIYHGQTGVCVSVSVVRLFVAGDGGAGSAYLSIDTFFESIRSESRRSI
jgi:hypothetical protein